MKIETCTYNAENDTLDMLTTNGSKMNILCAVIEDSIHTGIIGRSKLIWLKDNEPSTYAELVVTDRLQEFLDQYTEGYHKQRRLSKNSLQTILTVTRLTPLLLQRNYDVRWITNSPARLNFYMISARWGCSYWV
jgi:hypothetical protein